MTPGSVALARTLVETLAGAGVTDACMSPGSRSAPLALALHGEPRIRLHVRIDERSAAFLATGIARTSRRPVALVCTSGSAAANFHPAVVEADASRIPLLVLTADRPPELRGAGANQTIDQIKLYGGAVRWFCEVGAAEGASDNGAQLQQRYWRSLARRAVTEAIGAGGPPGPVHLNVGLREPLVPTAGEDGQLTDGAASADRRVERAGEQRGGGGVGWRAERTAAAPARRPVRIADPGSVDALAALIEAEPRGLFVLGDTAADLAAVLALAEAAAWPVLAEPTSNARRGPLALAAFAHLLADQRFAAAHRPDALITVGRCGLSRPTLALLASARTSVLLDPDAAWLDPARNLDLVVAADPGVTAATVQTRVVRRQPTAWSQSWLAADAAVTTAIAAALDGEASLNEPRLARDVVALLPDGALLVAGSSMPIRDVNAFAAPRGGIRILGNRGASGIDGFVSTAIGAALSHPGPVVALGGDLSLLHDANGFLVGAGADHPPVDLTFIVINNDGGGIFSLLEQAALTDSFEALFGTPHGVDFGRFAALYGLGYRRVQRPDDLPAALTDARSAGGLHLVEVRTDRAVNAALHRRLVEVAGAALRS